MANDEFDNAIADKQAQKEFVGEDNVEIESEDLADDELDSFDDYNDDDPEELDDTKEDDDPA